jgi:hypothetical protein
METTTATAPAYWASYLINGDASGIDDDDREACDSWLESLDGWYVVGVADDDDGEPMEAYFARSHDASDYSPLAGDVLEYVLHRHG